MVDNCVDAGIADAVRIGVGMVDANAVGAGDVDAGTRDAGDSDSCGVVAWVFVWVLPVLPISRWVKVGESVVYGVEAFWDTKAAGSTDPKRRSGSPV